MLAFYKILTALFVGAIASYKPMANQAVKDAFEEIKAYLQRKGVDSLEALQRAPESIDIRVLVAKQLIDSDIRKDKELLNKAKILHSVVEIHDSVAAEERINLYELEVAYVKLKNTAAKSDVNFGINKKTFPFDRDLGSELWEELRGEDDKQLDYCLITPAEFAGVRVFYATDRDHRPHAKTAEIFGNDRSRLSLGYCDVSIPRDHRMGVLESPILWRLEFRSNTAKQVRGSGATTRHHQSCDSGSEQASLLLSSVPPDGSAPHPSFRQSLS